MAISKLILYEKIEKLVENIKRDPENTEKHIKVCHDAIKQYTTNQVQNALVTMVTSLYQGQIRQLKSDLAKCILAGGKDADPSERVELLRCLLGALEIYFGDDFSLLTNMCEQELEFRLKYGENIEDSDEEVLFEL